MQNETKTYNDKFSDSLSRNKKCLSFFHVFQRTINSTWNFFSHQKTYFVGACRLHLPICFLEIWEGNRDEDLKKELRNIHMSIICLMKFSKLKTNVENKITDIKVNTYVILKIFNCHWSNNKQKWVGKNYFKANL